MTTKTEVKAGHTVYVPCIDGDNGFVLPITIVGNRYDIPIVEGEHMRYAHRKWMNRLITTKQAKVYQSRRKAEMQLKLKGIFDF